MTRTNSDLHLLDTNLLIALAWPQHVHHAQAHAWFGKVGRKAWATCPLTQLGFVRISSNPKIIPDAVAPRDALAVLVTIVDLPGHRFLTADIAPIEAPVLGSFTLVGHRQVTDAYLLALAQHHDGKLATLDKGVAELMPDNEQRARYVTLVE